MHIFSKLSLAANIIILMAFIAEMLNILDMKYVTIIIEIAVTIQLTLLFVLIVIITIGRREIRGVKITRYQFNDRFINGNDYILPEHVSTTNPRKSAMFKVLLEITYADEPPEIAISRKSVTSVTQDIKDHIINVNSGIIENSFIFDADIIIKPGEKINFQLKKDAIIKSFFLGEFYVP